MSEIGSTIGVNIRSIRVARHLSMQDLSDLVYDLYDVRMSISLIGSWQRGERNVSAQHLLMLSTALDCSIIQLYGKQASIQQSAHLSDHEKQILEYGLNEWEGNYHPLIQLMGMYMSAPPSVRAQIAGTCVSIYRQAKKRGVRSTAPYRVGLEYIENECDKL